MIGPDSESLAAARRFEGALPRRLTASDAPRVFSGSLEFFDPYMIDGIPVDKLEALGWLHPALGMAAVVRWAANKAAQAPSVQQRQMAAAACALGSSLRLAESVASRLGDWPRSAQREMLEGRLADLCASWALARCALSDVATTALVAPPDESLTGAAAAVLVTALELQASALQLATASLPNDSASQVVLAEWGSAFVRMQTLHGSWQDLIELVAQDLFR